MDGTGVYVSRDSLSEQQFMLEILTFSMRQGFPFDHYEHQVLIDIILDDKDSTKEYWDTIEYLEMMVKVAKVWLDEWVKPNFMWQINDDGLCLIRKEHYNAHRYES